MNKLNDFRKGDLVYVQHDKNAIAEVVGHLINYGKTEENFVRVKFLTDPAGTAYKKERVAGYYPENLSHAQPYKLPKEDE